jgi:ABC-type multidrug transport system fused ATPase/permease subunit
MKLLTPLTKKNNMAYFKSLGQLNTLIEESYQGFEVLKNFNGKKQAVEDFEQINNSMISTGWRVRFFGGISMPSMNFLQNMIYIFIAVFGAINVVGGKILIGNIQAFLQYSSQFSKPSSQIGQSWSKILSLIASAERVFDVLDTEEMPEYQKAFAEVVIEPGSGIRGASTNGLPTLCCHDHQETRQENQTENQAIPEQYAYRNPSVSSGGIGPPALAH